MFSWRFTLILCIGIMLDQASKALAISKLTMTSSITLVPAVLNLQLVLNTGAAYGILQNQRLFLLLVGLFVILAALLLQRFFTGSNWMRWGLVLLVSGAVGNFIDRLVLGYVIDFLQLRFFPVFNIADLLINAGLICLVLDLIFQPGERKTPSLAREGPP